jgi:ribosomal protein S25
MNGLAEIDAQIADLQHCADRIRGGTCPQCSDAASYRRLQKVTERHATMTAKVQPSAARPAVNQRKSKVTDEAVLGVVSKHKGATASQVVEDLGVSMSVAFARLTQLADRGVLTKGDDKRYRRAIEGAV